MNRCNIRLRLAGMTTWVASIALLAAALSGCGAGQISQTANQKPAVNGNRLTINNVLLRDIRIQAVQTSDFIQPGKAVDLVLVAVNQSPDVSDRLVGITSDIGSVTVAGDARLPASGMLFVGTPDGQIVAPGPLPSNQAAKATVNLTKPIANGLTYNFTFKFEKAGQGSVMVPISAGLATPHESAPHRRQTSDSLGLSHPPDTVTAWPTLVRSTAVRNAAMSARSGWDAAWSAAAGAP